MDLKEGFLSQVTLELRSENEGVNWTPQGRQAEQQDEQ